MDNLKTEIMEGPVGFFFTIAILICFCMGIYELENFSKSGERGLLINAAEKITKPIGRIVGKQVKPQRPADLDFPRLENMSDSNSTLADSNAFSGFR